MKSLLVGALLLAPAACADTILDVTATTSQGAFGPGNAFPDITLIADIHVKPEFGTFFDPGNVSIFTGTAYVVTKFTGTLNGLRISLLSPPASQGPDWLKGPNDWEVGNLYFSAGGFDYRLETDAVVTWLGGTDPNPGTLGAPLVWRPVDPPTTTPEPSVLTFAVIGFFASMLALIYRKQKGLS
jgi:hypothetical protein